MSYPFYEAEDNVKIGTTANEISMKYNNSGSFNSQYVYNAETNQYKRYSANVETVDYETNESIELANILFFEMPHQIVDNAGRREITITGGGNAYVAQAGTIREVKWKNADGLFGGSRRRWNGSKISSRKDMDTFRTNISRSSGFCYIFRVERKWWAHAN